MSDKADSRTIKRMQADKAEVSFGIRLKHALGGRDMSWLSRETGISTSTLSDYTKGKLPRVDKALQIATALDVSLDSLLKGDLDGYLRNVPPGALSDTSGETVNWDVDACSRQGSDLVEVAEIDPRFGLGGTFMDEEAVPEMRTFSRAWLRHITHSPPEELYWARGRGDSMEPKIADGDICLIDRSETSPEKFGDTYWAIAYGQTGMIKRLRPMPDGSVKILSNNPDVPPETAYEGELHVFGRVVAVVKKV